MSFKIDSVIVSIAGFMPFNRISENFLLTEGRTIRRWIIGSSAAVSLVSQKILRTGENSDGRQQ